MITKITNNFGDHKDHKLIFSQKQDPIDRIEMIAQVWENKVFKNEDNKEKFLGKILDRYWNEDPKTNILKILFFFDSPTL